MKTKGICAVLLVLCLVFTFASFPITYANSEKTIPLTLDHVKKALSSNAGFFTENKGQWDQDILFVGNTSFGKIAFTKEAVYYQLVKAESMQFNIIDQNPMDQLEQIQNRKVESQTIKLSFVNGQEPLIRGENLLPHYHNYFLGNDSSKWASYCRNYTRVTYEDIWEGIDLAYFFTPEGMKYEYYVAPQADMKDLRIQVEGAELSNLDDTLEINTSLGKLQDSNLIVFDQVTKSPMNTSFSLHGDTYTFQGIPEIRENSIVIDPLIYSTFLGGNDFDFIFDMVVDSSDNAYVTGWTTSTDFPTTPGSYNPSYSMSDSDAFVTKLNPTGTGLIFSTYLGANNWDYANAIDMDEIGNIYITGETMSGTWPVTVGAYDTTKNGGGYDGYVTKLNPAGAALIFSTYIGGSGNDFCNDIAIGTDHYVYITGTTESSDFPTTPFAFQSVKKGWTDIFVTKFNPNGSILIYSTYIGGSAEDASESLVLKESSGNFMNVFVTGRTNSSDFPVTPGAYQTNFINASDAYVLKLDSYGSSLVYATYLPSSGDWGTGYDIQVDADGYAYVCGITNGTDYPVTPGAFQTSHAGGLHGFVSKLNPSGSALVYSTYLGGSAGEWLECLQIESSGNVIIGGYTKSEDFPITPGAYQTEKKYDWDAFITMLNTNGSAVLYSSFFGGNDEDACNAIALNAEGEIFLAGYTYSSAEFPISVGAYQSDMNSYADSFVAKLNIVPLEISLTGSVQYNKIELNWNVFNPSDIFIFGYQIYRASVNNPFELLAFAKGSYAQSYIDTTGELGESYLYYVEAVDDFYQGLAISNELLLGPIQALPYPDLELSVELNKHEFCYGDDVLYKVTIHNISDGPASTIKLLVTFPVEIKYVSAGLFRGQVQAGGNALFEIGSMPGKASITFQINGMIAHRTSVKTSVSTLFYVSCSTEGVFAETSVFTTIKSCDGGNPIPYIRVTLLNTQFDPETGERYINQDTELGLDVTIDGFTPPYKMEVLWGDGERDLLDKQTEKTLHLKHTYTSGGVMEIRIRVEDTSGKSKEVSVRIKVK